MRRRAGLDPAETRSAVAHLVRRAVFGAPADEIDELAALGYEGAVDRLLDGLDGDDPGADSVPAPEFRTLEILGARQGTAEERRAANARAGEERRALVLWWVQRMVAADRPIREKLTFLWHDHFATSLEKVSLAELLHRQYRTLYDLGPGRFDDLVGAVARDPAMLVWLDGRESRVGAPNENFSRELFELFTLGHAGAHAHHVGSAYSEDDVADAARALTGWSITPAIESVLVPGRHDDGTKTVLGTTGRLGLDDVVAAATQHPACAPHVVSRLWSRLARPAAPDDPVVVELAAAFAADLDVRSLLRAMFLHPDFLAPATRTALVRTPVDLVVGLCRTVGVTPDERALGLLAGLGQVPFVPPDVSGWPANEAWLSTGSALLRLRLADFVAERTAVAERLGTRADRWPDELARLLGIDDWGPTAATLRAAPDARTALTVALVAPEHLVA